MFGTGTAWPGLIVAAIMAVLCISGGAQIILQALEELTPKNTGYVMAAE